jgi:hypothetical protein
METSSDIYKRAIHFHQVQGLVLDLVNELVKSLLLLYLSQSHSIARHFSDSAVIMATQDKPNGLINGLTNGHLPSIFTQHNRSLPLIIMTALPESGHTNPLIQIATYLIQRGYRIFFLASQPFEAQIVSVGAEFHLIPPHVTADRLATLVDEFPMPDGMDPPSWYVRRLGVEPMATRHAALVYLMEDVRRRYPEDEVVLFRDVWSFHVLPLWYGAALPKGYDMPPKVIGISTLFLLTYSVDVPPFFQEVPLVEVPSKERIAELWKKQEPWQREMVQRVNEELKKLGCRNLMKEPWILDEKTLASDVVLVACSRSLDLYRSDLQAKIHYAGCVPSNGPDPHLVYPEWWSEITANEKLPTSDPAKKRLVLITQGTVNRDYRQLLMPTLKALGERENIVTIALLGHPGAQLPDGFEIPANAHIMDYFPYEAVLPYANVMVSNAGFGSIMHGIMHGVPMVFGGNTEDKAEVSLRGERAGIAINLQTPTPAESAVREAVDRVLGDGRFKSRALEMMKENEDLDFLGAVERWIWKVQQMPA